MAKSDKKEIRGHAEERSWLLTLGSGNIFKGVQNLIEKENEEKPKGSKGGKK